MQETIMTAIMRTANQNADVLGTLKLHIGMGLGTGDAEDNSMDIHQVISILISGLSSSLMEILFTSYRLIQFS